MNSGMNWNYCFRTQFPRCSFIFWLWKVHTTSWHSLWLFVCSEIIIFNFGQNLDFPVIRKKAIFELELVLVWAKISVKRHRHKWKTIFFKKSHFFRFIRRKNSNSENKLVFYFWVAFGVSLFCEWTVLYRIKTVFFSSQC